MANERIFEESFLRHFLPALKKLGFEKWKPPGCDEGRVVHLARIDGERRDLLDIQFDKYGRRRCYINVARLTDAIVETMFEGAVPKEIVSIAQLRDRCRLWGNGFGGAFKPPFLFGWFINTEQAGVFVARRICKELDALEDWFRTGRTGKRFRCYRL